MEEDIKILKNMLKISKKNRRGNDEIRFEVNSNYYKAIENLIARNKELEEKLENWKFTANYVEKNYISKAKIEEKIEELEKERKKQEKEI